MKAQPEGPPSAISKLRRNLRWGIGNGLFMGCFFTAVVLVIRVVPGNRPFERTGVTIASTIAVYLIGGMLAGAIIGLLRPLARYALGAMLVSIPAALPVAIRMAVAFEGPPSHWARSDWANILLLTGLRFGYLVKREEARSGLKVANCRRLPRRTQRSCASRSTSSLSSSIDAWYK
jgi:hypothetical protein